MHYVIGDIHGCFDELMDMIKRIDRKDPKAEYILLGDFPDRGPKVWETMNWVSQNVSPVSRFKSVQGNHDRLLQEWFFDWADWYNKQPLKDKLLNQLDHSEEPKPDYDFYDIAKAHKSLTPRKLNRFIATYAAMPYHMVVEVPCSDGSKITYDIVHGWYAYDYPDRSYGQHMFNTWARECEGNHVNDHIIVHGHTPTVTELYTRDPSSPPGMIVYRKNAINLDGGCCYFDEHKDKGYPCMLCAICLETLEEFYSHRLDARIGKERASAFREKYYSKPDPYRAEMLARLGIEDPSPVPK